MKVGSDKNKDWTMETLWCGALEEEGSTNIVDCVFTQTQQPPPQSYKTETSINVCHTAEKHLHNSYLWHPTRKRDHRPDLLQSACR